MALQSDGAITLAQIAAEFGGSTPHSLSEYYRNGSFVTSNNTNVPTSGTIDFADFYGAVKQITVTISSGATNQNASTLFGSNFTSNVPKILIINSGVELGATSLSNYALQVPSGMSGTLNIQNAGTISGAGGDGSTSLSSAGDAGGTALFIASSNVTVTNTGTIRGGGGGGGRGNNGVQGGTTNPGGGIYCFSGTAGQGGNGGNGQGYDQSQTNGAGGGARGAGSHTGGAFGAFYCGGYNASTDGSAGGNGGTYGNAGGNGADSGSAGGAAGKYIQLSGVSYTLSNSGTLQGNAP